MARGLFRPSQLGPLTITDPSGRDRSAEFVELTGPREPVAGITIAGARDATADDCDWSVLDHYISIETEYSGYWIKAGDLARQVAIDVHRLNRWVDNEEQESIVTINDLHQEAVILVVTHADFVRKAPGNFVRRQLWLRLSGDLYRKRRDQRGVPVTWRRRRMSPSEDELVDALDLRSALAQLPPDDARTTLLYHGHGFTRDEVAAREGVATGTASNRAARGLAALRSALAVRD